MKSLLAGRHLPEPLVPSCPVLSKVDTAAALFVCRKTVEAHLTRVYRKLGVRSRIELACLLLKHDLPTSLRNAIPGRRS